MAVPIRHSPPSSTFGPDATGVGHFWYTVESPTLSLRDLRTLQDWFIRYQLNAVPGVAEVASVGGYVQQYQIDVRRRPNRLRVRGESISKVLDRPLRHLSVRLASLAQDWAQ